MLVNETGAGSSPLPGASVCDGVCCDACWAVGLRARPVRGARDSGSPTLSTAPHYAEIGQPAARHITEHCRCWVIPKGSADGRPFSFAVESNPGRRGIQPQRRYEQIGASAACADASLFAFLPAVLPLTFASSDASALKT